jgi:hypothetical protein
MVRAHLLSSVRVGVVSDLAALWRSRLGIDVEVVSSLSDAEWREQRAGGRASSLSCTGAWPAVPARRTAATPRFR